MTSSRSILNGALIFKVLLVGLLFLCLTNGSLFAGRLKIKELVFVGNHHFSANELRGILKSKPGALFNNKLMRLDRILLRNFYQSKGFLEVWVETGIKRSGENITIKYTIAEGKQFLLKEIRISGGQILTNEQMRKTFKIKDGDIFRRQQIENGLNLIENYYYNHGKPYVEFDQKQVTRDSLITIFINVKEHETVVIKDIGYVGLKQTHGYIVHRELEIKPGEIYSRKKIEKSQKNIYSTGLFDFVGMDLKPILGDRSRVVLNIRVVEKKARWVGARFGVAYEQQTVYGGTFDFTLEFGHRNLFGSARSVSVNVIPSLSYDFTKGKIINPKNQFSFTYVEPWIGYTRTPGILQASYFQVRPLNSADYDYFTSSFQVRHKFSNNWQTSGTIAFNQVRILSEDTLGQVYFTQTRGQDFIYSLGVNIIRDSRDNYLNPQEGSVVETNIKFAYSKRRDDKTGLTTLNRFIKVILQWNRYQAFPYRKGWIFATRLRGGNIFELGARGHIPLLERFYLGGASSVRGYSEQLLGPVSFDENGRASALGGKLFLLGNFELRFPVFWLFWGEIFFDAGNVWAETNLLKLNEIKPASGLGVALVTPFGPIRFDYGVKLKPETYEKRGEFHISISFAF
ncbi:hypothetical protein B1H10_05550 [candidate division KSB1 bacterium 4484_188]|nr:MAG: hypothetical protein B1H10_05550 [candidate division KSB1 bacterium 4484_188]